MIKNHCAHLHHGAVAGCKQLVQPLDLVSRRIDVTRHCQALGHLQRLVIGDSHPDVHWDLDDLLGELLRKIFDAGASLTVKLGVKLEKMITPKFSSKGKG